MKNSLSQLISKLQGALLFVKRYAGFIFAIVLLGIFGFFVFRINQFSNAQPDQTQVDEKLQSVARPKVDKSVVDKIQQLQGQNVQVQSLFDNARNNPFNE